MCQSLLLFVIRKRDLSESRYYDILTVNLRNTGTEAPSTNRVIGLWAVLFLVPGGGEAGDAANQACFSRNGRGLH